MQLHCVSHWNVYIYCKQWYTDIPMSNISRVRWIYCMKYCHLKNTTRCPLSKKQLLYWLIWPFLLKCHYISTRLHGFMSQGFFFFTFTLSSTISLISFIVYGILATFPTVYRWQVTLTVCCIVMNWSVPHTRAHLTLFWVSALVQFCLESHIFICAEHV